MRMIDAYNATQSFLIDQFGWIMGKKGQLGLNDLPGIVQILIIIGAFAGVGIVVMAALRDSFTTGTPEFNAINYSFRCKTITTKRNKLVPANITYKKVKVDFDARAYRFNNSGVATLYDKQGNIAFPSITAANLNTINIPETALNLFVPTRICKIQVS